MGAIGLIKRSQTGFQKNHFMCLKSSLDTYADTSTTFPGAVIYPRAVSGETTAQAVTAKSETPGNKSRISLHGVGCGSRQKLLLSTDTTSRIWRTNCSCQNKVLAKPQDESGTRLPRSSECEVQRGRGEWQVLWCVPSSGTTGTPMMAEAPPRVKPSICAMKWANILRHTAWVVGVTKASPRGAEC